MSVTEKAVFVIERNHERNLSLGDIAAACGVSTYHLAHAFGRTAGVSVMHYLRSRRLSGAAAALSQGAGNILDLALDTGYSSHEAFSRAFRLQFGVTPEAVRDAASLEGIQLAQPLQFNSRSQLNVIQPQLRDAPEIRAVGLKSHYFFEDAAAGVPGQWQRFMKLAGSIPDQRPGIPIGVAAEVDPEGGFDYWCAVEVLQFSRAPVGCSDLVIPPHRYAVFEHRRHISAISETYRAIWDEWLPALGLSSADAPLIERHTPAFNTLTGEGGVDLWIPIQPGSGGAHN